MTSNAQTALAIGDLEVLTGEVESVRLVGDDFFGIAEVRLEANGRATVVGKLLGAREGDTVEVRGAWSEHPKYGRQFKARRIDVRVPSSAAGVIAWLESRIPHLGRHRATTLVERFGVEGLWQALEGGGEALLDVPGISEARRAKIVEAYHNHRSERDLMVRLKGWGLTDHQIAHVLTTWGERAEATLKRDPYRLIDEVRGFGFKRADSVARRMGLTVTSPNRIRAGLVHVLEEAAGAGHAYVPSGKLVKLAAQLLNVDAERVARELGAVCDAGRAVARGVKVYRPRIERAERGVAEAVLRMTQAMKGQTHGEEERV